MRRTRSKKHYLTCVGLVVLLATAPGCAKKKKAQEASRVLTARQTYELAQQAMREGKARKARTLLEQIQYAPEERGELEPKVRLALADATYYQDYALALIDARSLYLDFVTLYAEHPRAPYAQYQAGMCSLAQVRHPTKDQTQTHQSIVDFEEVERRFPNSPFAEAARMMIRRAQSNLAEHDFVVGRFYLKRKKPLAAADRFRGILNHYPDYAEKDKLYFYLGQALLRADNKVEARIYLDKLVTDYPDGAYSEQAIKELSKVGGRIELDLPRPH